MNVAALKLRATEQQAKLDQEARERSLRLKKEQDREAQRVAARKLKAQQRAEVSVELKPFT